MGFSKLDEGILQSSIMTEPPETFKVFIALLAACDPDGIARVAPPFIASVCRLSDEATLKAFERLESPDPLSRSLADEGRRVRRVDGGYEIINYLKYRAASYSFAPDAIRKREYREKNKNKETNGTLSGRCPDASASASSSASSSGINSIKTWRDEYKLYESEVSAAYDKLLADEEWMAERRKYHPGLDIRLTMQKAFNDFWGQEAGWAHKKKSRIKTIDWKMTFTNALTMRANQVWLKRPMEK